MTQRETLLAQRQQVDLALFFILLSLAGTVLFYLATLGDRRDLCRALEGETPGKGSVGVRLRWMGGALITGAVGYFFLVSLGAARRAKGNACPSATRNLWAGALVMAATLLRLWDREAAPLEQAQTPLF